MKSKAIAYILWLFCGVAGVHRFYLDKIGSGLVWLFTGGLFGLGWIVDFFTLGSQVDAYNRAHGYYGMNYRPHFSDHFPRFGSYAQERISPERQVLSLAREKPDLSAKDVILNTSLGLEEAERVLRSFVDKGIATERVTKEGKIRYDFR